MMVFWHTSVWIAAKLMRNSLIKIYSRDFKSPTHFVMEILINFISCCRKGLIHINTWMVGRGNLKCYYLQKRIFTALESIAGTDEDILGKLSVAKCRLISWSVCAKLYLFVCRCVRGFWENMLGNLWTRCRLFSFSIWISVTDLFKGNRSQVVITYRHWYVINGWKGNMYRGVNNLYG